MEKYLRVGIATVELSPYSEAWPNILFFCRLPTSPHSSLQTLSLTSDTQLQTMQPFFSFFYMIFSSNRNVYV